MADTALGVVIPLHAHVGMSSVIEDYVGHRPTRTALKTALTLCTAATLVCGWPSGEATTSTNKALLANKQAAGFNFNINGLGIGSALRCVWAL